MAALTDDQIVSMLQVGIRQSTGYSDSHLSSERLRTARYYNGELPRPLHPGNSKYVSMDVYDSHESMKAQLLEVFSGNNQPVTFGPQGANDVEMAREATETCTYTIFRQNPGYAIFRDVIDDSLGGRAGVAKVWWESRIDDVPYEMSDTNFSELQQHLASNPDMEVEKVEIEEGTDESALHSLTPIKSVLLTTKQDLSQVRILPLPPEEFFISPRSVGLHTAELCGHRFRRSYSELLKDGYKKADLDELRDSDNVLLTTEPELIERFQQTDDILLDNNVLDGGGTSVANKEFTVYECYAELDPEDTGKKTLHQVIMIGDKIMHKQVYARRPFIAFVPLPRPHAFWGTSYDSLTIPIQNARSALTRAIIDHTLQTTNQRYTVLRGGLDNPRELMENRIGGIVNIKRPDAIQPLQQGTLNPFVFQTGAMLEDDKESRTGISRLSQGLNKDAVSKQNSADMVEQLISMSQVRQKIIARNFGEGFLRDLYLEVYRLLAENEKKERLIQIAGSWSPIDPTKWPERDDLVVVFSLGYGEEQKEATKWVTRNKVLSEDPGAARMYTESNKYAVLRQALLHSGVKDVDSYLTNPATLPPPQPDPMHQADIAVKQADAQVKLANAEAAKTKVQLDMQKLQLQHQLEMAKLQAQIGEQRTKAQLEQDKLMHKVAVDSVELQLQQQAAADAKLQAFAEPTH